MPRSSKSSKTSIYVIIGALLLGVLLFFARNLFKPEPLEVNQTVGAVGHPAEPSQRTPVDGTTTTMESIESHPVKVAEPVAVDISTLREDEQKSWAILQEIIKSKNDNDPRLDKDLRSLTPAFHHALQAQYKAFPMESRSERGLVTYLIARDLKTAEDLQFLKTVYEESPCLSLENCATRIHSDPHLSGIDDTSANYPQLAALFQLEKILDTKPQLLNDPNMKDHFRAVLEQASKFPVPVIQRKAAEILARLP